MKFLILIIAFQFTHLLSALAEDQSLHQALQKEYVYLNSQKQALIKLKENSKKSLTSKKTSLTQEINQLENQLVSLSGNNDQLHENLLVLDQRKKELQKRGTTLDQTYTRAQKLIASMEASHRFEIFNEKDFFASTPEKLSIQSFEPLFERTQNLIKSSTQSETYPASFLDENNRLVSGNVTRFGQSAAIGQTQDKHYILAPNGEGLLKTLNQTTQPSGQSLSLFIFDNLLKEAQLKQKAGLIEKLADFSPIIFLGLILMLVAGLFTALIKV